MLTSDTIDIDTPFGYLEDVPVEFDLEIEEVPAEPYSWGEGRRPEKEIRVDIRKLFGQPVETVLEVHPSIDLERITRVLEDRHGSQ